MNIPEHIQQAIQAYYAERATDDDIAALEQWFREDELNVKAFAEHGMIEWQMLNEHEKADATAILTVLREAEDKAEPDFSLLSLPASDFTTIDPAERSVSIHDLYKLTGYLAAKGLRTKAALIGSIAAVIVLGVVLYLAVFGFGSDSPETPEIADDTTNKPTIESPSIVATLTDEHDAEWDRRPGEDLYAGQRFTLTGGFAEITTARNAVAILEAPATIELTHHDNAIQLHNGKLVGICETKSSKGFLVRTPHMDIVDLGTRFSVESSKAGNIELYVFEGEVKASSPNNGDASTSILAAGDAATFEVGLLSDKFAFEVPHTQDATNWQALINSPKFQGDIHFMSGMPKASGGKSIESDQILAFRERAGLQLHSPLKVTIDTPGNYRSFNRSAVIPAGVSVDSYFLHLNPPGEPKPGEYPRRVGSINFSRPVLGVIAEPTRLQESHSVLAIPGVVYPGGGTPTRPAFHGLEQVDGKDLDDILHLSEDRKTLTIDLRSGTGFDQLRVLIEAQE